MVPKSRLAAEGKVSSLDFYLLVSLLPLFFLLPFPFTEHLLGFILVGSFHKNAEFSWVYSKVQCKWFKKFKAKIFFCISGRNHPSNNNSCGSSEKAQGSKIIPFKPQCPRRNSLDWSLCISLRISSENVIKDQSIFPLMIILLILIAFALDVVLILSGEICRWSLLGLKQGLYRVLNSWKSLGICPAIFQTWKKSGKKS